MSFLLLLSVVLIGSPLGKTFVLHPEEPAAARPSPAIRTSRCQVESLQSIQKILLSSLNLQTEPQLSAPGMIRVRDLWKGSFQTESTQPGDAESRAFSEISVPRNSSVLQCCTLSSQIFIKDLGWENWIIHPESFTYVQCSGCVPQTNQSIPHCRGDDPPSAQEPCCEPTASIIVPFLYLDETGSITIASVPLTSECGCRSRSDAQDPEP
uniref:TGF-beta family profile domain-containing protein n=1 Tax=Astyanax mexicanus TaxID=7994 RepID=A0A8B9LRG0_ASTMX